MDEGNQHMIMTSTSRFTRAWRWPKFVSFTALLAFIGVLVFMYPNVANWFSQYNQASIIRTVESDVDRGPQSRLEAEIDLARSYNQALVGGALLAANTNVPTGDGTEGGDLEYNNLLNADTAGTMGRLRIPAIKADLPIYHGTSDHVLEKGVGHLQGTSLPVGGESQHSVLTAHRGLATSELFSHLDQVNIGDHFTVEVFGEVFTYRVITTQVVEPHETESLYPQAGQDLMTLVTCTPLGINTHRILVTGERITPTPITDIEQAGAAPEIPGFPWWIVIISGTALLLATYVWQMGYTSRFNPVLQGKLHKSPEPVLSTQRSG